MARIDQDFRGLSPNFPDAESKSNHRAISGTPVHSEWSPFHLGYLASRLPGLPGNERILDGLEDDAASFLERQVRELRELKSSVPADRERHRYAPGKWSVRELVGHLADTERILSFRALAAARGDQTNIQPFDEEAYAASAGHDDLPLGRLVDDLLDVRRSTLALARTFTADQWHRQGVSNGCPVSARAWMFVIGVHADLHLDTLRNRYLA